MPVRLSGPRMSSFDHILPSEGVCDIFLSGYYCKCSLCWEQKQRIIFLGILSSNFKTLTYLVDSFLKLVDMLLNSINVLDASVLVQRSTQSEQTTHATVRTSTGGQTNMCIILPDTWRCSSVKLFLLNCQSPLVPNVSSCSMRMCK